MAKLRFVKIILILFYLFLGNRVHSSDISDRQLDDALRIILNPQENDSMQVLALRRQLLDKVNAELREAAAIEDANILRKNLESMAYWNDLPLENKRNLEALARSGTWYKNPPDNVKLDDTDYKRSIAYLAKNGQPPLLPIPLNARKRAVEALARNGYLQRPLSYSNYRTLLEDMFDKRNLADVVRGDSFPVGNSAGFGKRSISSLAKTGQLPYGGNGAGKRNVQSLARDGLLGKRSTVAGVLDSMEFIPDKRNIQSIKAQQRNKRDADYFTQNDYIYPDYEDVFQEFQEPNPDLYPVEDKRFLGRLPQMGKPRTTAIPKSRRYQ